MKRYNMRDVTPYVTVHPDGEWIRYTDHVEAMKRIAGDSGKQAEPVAWSANWIRDRIADQVEDWPNRDWSNRIIANQIRRIEIAAPAPASPSDLFAGNAAFNLGYAKGHEDARTAPSASAQQASADRAMLEAVSKDLEISSWECPRCGHGEDCRTMDAAMMLRDYLAAPAPSASPADPRMEALADAEKQVEESAARRKEREARLGLSGASPAALTDSQQQALNFAITALAHVAYFCEQHGRPEDAKDRRTASETIRALLAAGEKK